MRKTRFSILFFLCEWMLRGSGSRGVFDLGAAACVGTRKKPHHEGTVPRSAQHLITFHVFLSMFKLCFYGLIHSHYITHTTNITHMNTSSPLSDGFD